MQFDAPQHAHAFSLPILHRMRVLIAVCTAVGLLSALAAIPTLAAEIKSFSGVKTCSGLLPTTPLTQTCVLNPSSLKILLGGTVHYTDIVFYNSVGLSVPRSAATYLSSPVVFKAIDRRNSAASGRCTFFIAGPKAGTGHCEWAGGTGRLAGFHAVWAVGTLGPHVFSLRGVYWFDRDRDGGDDGGSD